MNRNPLKPFTSAELRSMTREQIHDAWRARQIARRALGLDYFASLIGMDGNVVVTVEATP